MHIQHRNTAVNNLHTIKRCNIRNCTASTVIHLAKFGCLPSNTGLIHHIAQYPNIFCVGIIGTGFPPGAALHNLNSLLALGSSAAAVTVDLAEVALDTGIVHIYKWGAAPSILISSLGAEKIGTAGPPPGLSVTEPQVAAYGLSLRRGETLFLVSDGVGEEEALHLCTKMAGASPGEMAEALLSCSQISGEDDATVVTVQLKGT